MEHGRSSEVSGRQGQQGNFIPSPSAGGNHMKPLLGGEMSEASEGASKSSGNILRKFMHWAKAIPYMSDDVVQRLICI